MQKSSIDRAVENMHAEIRRVNVSIYTTVESYKRSIEQVPDERAIDAFIRGIHISDLVEGIGRTCPRTVA
jgi:hypothetical protein